MAEFSTDRTRPDVARRPRRVHHGTPRGAEPHGDVPAHFIPEGKTLDDFSIESFIGEGAVIDLTPKELKKPMTRADIETYELDIQPGDVVMLHTGWGEYYGQTPEYLFEFPYVTGEAAEYVVSLDPKAVGSEGASVGG